VSPVGTTAARGVDDWPAPDRVVLAHRTLRAGTTETALSLFGDPIWYLGLAHPDAHTPALGIVWDRFDAPFVLPIKTFVLATLDHPWPADAGMATRAIRKAERPGVLTIRGWARQLQVFTKWLTDRDVLHPHAVTDQDLNSYRDHVLALARSPRDKANLLTAVRMIWCYREHLPTGCRFAITSNPWDGVPAGQLTKTPKGPYVNKTPRISTDTMECLLAWSLRVIEDIGPDITAAWLERERRVYVPPAGTDVDYGTMTAPKRAQTLIDLARRTGMPLPGKVSDGRVSVNWARLAALIGRHVSAFHLGSKARALIEESGLPIAPERVGRITGQINGRLWRKEPIAVDELPHLVLMLTASCFVVICYLSGMRPGEVLNLRRGCRHTDERTGELLLRGQIGKGRDRQPPADTAEPGNERRWAVVGPVHAAVAMLEDLNGQDLLFPAVVAHPGPRPDNEGQARKQTIINANIQQFIDWVNTTFVSTDGTPAIPPDPQGPIYGSRFRRTLAYFIVRRPRGLIAAALQYGHVQTKVTLGYSGTADTGWMEDLAIERLEFILEQNDEDWTRLEAGEHVSGPAVAEYRARLAHARRFAGRMIPQVRNARRLLNQADPDIHHGQAMTCVWRPETAACHKDRRDPDLPAPDGPDQAECRSTCQNLAYTDRDIQQMTAEVTAMERAAADPLAPRPLRDRAAARAVQRRVIITRHHASRPANERRDEEQ
jgi:integrase